MAIATIIVTCLVLSLIAALVFYCATALASKVTESSDQESEIPMPEQPSQFAVASNETLVSTNKATAQETAQVQ